MIQRGCRTTIWILIVALFALRPARADEKLPGPVAGQMLIGQFQHAARRFAAFETMIGDQKAIAVIGSDRTIPLARVRRTLAEGKELDDWIIRGPHVVVYFSLDGKVLKCEGWGSKSEARTKAGLSGSLRVEDGRVRGKARLETQDSEMLAANFTSDEKSMKLDMTTFFSSGRIRGPFAMNFDFTFDVPLGLDTPREEEAPPQADPVMKVKGTFTGDGKPIELRYASVRWTGKIYEGEPMLEAIITERDHRGDEDAFIDSQSGKYGCALEINFTGQAACFGGGIYHPAIGQYGVTGVLESRDCEIIGRQMSGTLTTYGPDEIFGHTWQVDLEFAAPVDGERPVVEP